MSVGRRCGFLARSFLGIGGLIVSRGYGPCAVVDDVVDEGDELQEGTGQRTRITAQQARAPKTYIRYTGKKKGG